MKIAHKLKTINYKGKFICIMHACINIWKKKIHEESFRLDRIYLQVYRSNKRDKKNNFFLIANKNFYWNTQRIMKMITTRNNMQLKFWYIFTFKSILSFCILFVLSVKQRCCCNRVGKKQRTYSVHLGVFFSRSIIHGVLVCLISHKLQTNEIQ